jgi:hypothetical protein
MLESAVQVIYLAQFPLESPMWFGKPGHFARELMRSHPDKKPPKNVPPNSKEMVDRFTKQNPERSKTLNAIYDSWVLMSKGAHPTSEGMRQTTTDDNALYVVGATHVDDLCLVGFDHGLFAIDRLLSVLAALRPQTEEWMTKHAALTSSIGNWRKATAKALGIADFIAPDEDIS